MWLSHREVIEFSSLKRISNNWITSWVNKCHQHVFLFYSMIVCMFVAVCVWKPLLLAAEIFHLVTVSWLSVPAFSWADSLWELEVSASNACHDLLACWQQLSEKSMMFHGGSNVKMVWYGMWYQTQDWARGINNGNQCFKNDVTKYILKMHCIHFVKWPHWDSFAFHCQKCCVIVSLNTLYGQTVMHI